MVGKKIAVVGWYGKGNVGDEAFKAAFPRIFPALEFSFFDGVPFDINSYDGLWIGGGSLLDEFRFNMANIRIPVALIGVGIGKKPTEKNLVWAANAAKVIVVRDKASATFLPNAIVAPDLCFVNPLLANPKQGSTMRVSVLVNDFLNPKTTSDVWEGDAHRWFCHELAQVVDELLLQGYKVDFCPMGVGGIDDRRAAAGVISRLKRPDSVEWMLTPADNQPLENAVHNSVANADFVITQRYHGMIYATQAGRRFLAISAHDKLKNYCSDLGYSGIVDYYGFSKARTLEAMKLAQAVPPQQLLDYAKAAREQWKSTSATVMERFFG